MASQESGPDPRLGMRPTHMKPAPPRENHSVRTRVMPLGIRQHGLRLNVLPECTISLRTTARSPERARRFPIPIRVSRLPPLLGTDARHPPPPEPCYAFKSLSSAWEGKRAARPVTWKMDIDSSKR